MAVVKKRLKPKGLGDSLANLTYITGIDTVIKAVTKAVGVEDCGCSKRQEALNKVFPYKK